MVDVGPPHVVVRPHVRLDACAPPQSPGPTGAVIYGWQIYPENGAAPLRFATRQLNGFFTGALDEMAIFDRPLTAAEIGNLSISGGGGRDGQAAAGT
jgi:hypothetical protein